MAFTEKDFNTMLKNAEAEWMVNSIKQARELTEAKSEKPGGAEQKKEAQNIPASIAQSPKTSPQEKAKILALQQQMKAKKTAEYEIGGVKVAKDMPPFLEQDRPEKVKDIYKALKEDHPTMPAEMKARIAARQGKKGKQKQGPPYKGPIKEAALNPNSWTDRDAVKAYNQYAQFMNDAIRARREDTKPGGITASERDNITRQYNKLTGNSIPMSKDYKGLQSFLAMAKRQEEKREKAYEYPSEKNKKEETLHHMMTIKTGADKTSRLYNDLFLDKQAQGPLTATLGEKGEALGAAAGLIAGTAIGAATAGKGGRIGGALFGSLLGTMTGASLGRIGTGAAELAQRGTKPGPYTPPVITAADRLEQNYKNRFVQSAAYGKGWFGKKVDKNLKVTRDKLKQRGFPVEKWEKDVTKQGSYEIGGLKIAATACDTPGEKKKSKGKGRGLARGKGKGPMGIPVGEKTATGEAAAAEELGLTSAVGDSVQHDQQAAKNNFIDKKETATTKDLKQIANPPQTTDALFQEKESFLQDIKKIAQGRNPYGMAPVPARGRGGPQVVYVMVPYKKPSVGAKAKETLKKHRGALPLLGTLAGAGGGALLAERLGIPGGALAGAGMGGAAGALGGHLAYRGLGPEKQGSYEIGGEKIAAELKPGEVTKKDLEKVYEKAVRVSKSPVRRGFIWDVGDIVGAKKGKEEYKPTAMIAMPMTRKTAQHTPPDPMMGGGDVRYTVGPSPEDVAEYLRTQEAARRTGTLAGAGLGAAGGGALGYYGGGALARGLGAGPGGEAAGRIAGTLLGGGLGGIAGGRLGAPAGEALGGMIAERTTPAAQIEAPFLTPGRAEATARRLAVAPMLRGGRTPTVAIGQG